MMKTTTTTEKSGNVNYSISQKKNYYITNRPTFAKAVLRFECVYFFSFHLCNSKDNNKNYTKRTDPNC